METNPEFELAYDLLQNTRANVFLTGKAGTGKTTFLKSLRARLNKAMIVVAPTGVAALNAGGVTIHSFFQISPGPYTPLSQRSGQSQGQNRFFTLRKEKVRIIRGLQLLIIDEISMVRSDLLDAISDVLCRYRRSSEPFGGVQLLMIGDMQQLSPVVKDDEREILSRFYKSPYFFDSLALHKSFYTTIELTRIYRQSDRRFTDMLNSVRTGVVDRAVLTEINKRYIPDFNPAPEEGYITLTTHNSTMQSINDRKLAALGGEEYTYEATVGDDFPEMIYPTEQHLRLKAGAQVMFVRNDSSAEKRFYNGKLGVVSRLHEEWIEVQCEGEDEPITVSRERWENTRYDIDEQTQEITATVAGYFIQFPLRTAWAITVHKSQGLTFDRAIIDVGGAFAHGQVYVALSRCRTLEGLVLSSPIRPASFVSSPEVDDFNTFVSGNRPGPELIARLKKQFYTESVCEMFDFRESRKHLYNLHRLFGTALGRLHPERKEDVDKALSENEEHLFTVADKFCRQLQGMIAASDNYDTDPLIAERISKGAAYLTPFAEKAMELAQALSGLKVENKESAKVLKDNATALFFIMRGKKIYMRELGGGFNVEAWLRLKASIELSGEQKIQKPATAAKSKRPEGLTDAQEAYLKEVAPLFSTLVLWRKSKAEERGVPIYTVLGQRGVIEICEELPRTPAALSEIHGVGKVFMARYASEIIDIVTDFCRDTGIDGPSYETERRRKENDAETAREAARAERQAAKEAKAARIEAAREELKARKQAAKEAKEAEKEARRAAKAAQPSTYQITLEMYRSGKNAKEIAAEREMSVGTISGHLARFVESGEVSVYDFLDQPMVDEIISALNTQEFTTMKEIYDYFLERYSFDEIKYVLAHNKRLRTATGGEH